MDSREAQILRNTATPMRIACVHRASARGMRRVERIGVQIDGHIRHYHPMSLIYAIRVGAWQVLAMDSADNVPVLVTVEHGEDGRDCLSARSPDGANLLNVLAPCADEA